MKTYYLVSEETLKSILENTFKFHALETGGVDSWEWYGASLYYFLEEWALENKIGDEEHYSFKDIVKSELKNFKKIMIESEDAI